MTPEAEQRLIAELDSEWRNEGGFLFDYKAGKFNEDAYQRIRRAIVTIQFTPAESISKRLIERIYNIPFFLLRNKQNVLDNGGSRMLCNLAINQLNDLIEFTFSSTPQMDLLKERWARQEARKYMYDFDD
jgi:hypothetical protein